MKLSHDDKPYLTVALILNATVIRMLIKRHPAFFFNHFIVLAYFSGLLGVTIDC